MGKGEIKLLYVGYFAILGMPLCPRLWSVAPCLVADKTGLFLFYFPFSRVSINAPDSLHLVT